VSSFFVAKATAAGSFAWAVTPVNGWPATVGALAASPTGLVLADIFVWKLPPPYLCVLAAVVGRSPC
jgi:heme O synthase-like polyprenyltransferase